MPSAKLSNSQLDLIKQDLIKWAIAHKVICRSIRPVENWSPVVKAENKVLDLSEDVIFEEWCQSNKVDPVLYEIGTKYLEASKE